MGRHVAARVGRRRRRGAPREPPAPHDARWHHGRASQCVCVCVCFIQKVSLTRILCLEQKLMCEFDELCDGSNRRIVLLFSSARAVMSLTPLKASPKGPEVGSWKLSRNWGECAALHRGDHARQERRGVRTGAHQQRQAGAGGVLRRVQRHAVVGAAQLGEAPGGYSQRASKIIQATYIGVQIQLSDVMFPYGKQPENRTGFTVSGVCVFLLGGRKGYFSLSEPCVWRII